MFAEEIALRIVSNIAYGGITRAVGGISVSIQRRQAIERSLANPKDEKTKKFKRAIDELQKVIAHRFGANTKRLDDFLNELNRSAFPEVLTETILSGTDKAASKQLFESIFYSDKDAPEFDQFSDKFFSAVEAAVRAQYDMLSGDSDLLGAISAKSNAICTKVEHLCKVIGSIKAFDAKRTLTKIRIDELRGKLCKQLETKHRYITVETTRGARKYSISKLFIEPKFARLN